MKALGFVAWLIDQINEYVGKAVSWLVVLMVINVFVVVVLRYLFSVGWIWMQEIYIWLHATVFLLGAGYTLLHSGHVRIDLFYASASKKYKAAVDFFGSLFLALPLLYVLFDKSLPLILRSWDNLEKSAEAGGLPGVYLFKSLIAVFCVIFALQFISLLLKSLMTLLGHDPEEDQEQEVVQ